MRSAAIARHVFAGANTSEGFRSFFNYLISPEAHRIIVLKGGPGVGKSTFMKHIAESLLKMGHDVEMFHCSSDPESLDGMACPDLQVAVVDGTAPHIVDLRYPGAVDEIVYLGDYWDESAIRDHRQEIFTASKEKATNFSRAYRFLRTAGDVLNDWSEANSMALDRGKANRLASAAVKNVLGAVSEFDATVPGRVRELFASATTPDGFVNYVDSLVRPCANVYVVVGGPGTGKSTLLRRLADEAIRRGLDVELFHCSLNADSLEHIVLPQLSTAVITSVEPHEWQVRPEDKVIDMNSCLDPDTVKTNAPIIDYDRDMMNAAMDRAVHFLQLARQSHARLESYYIPNVDFDAVARVRRATLERIVKG
jgi:KaiC/GvpD/RAD55 family RecA-like ATPase